MLVETRCLFCKDTEDLVLYPPRLQEASFTAYTFSARRSRRREHYRIVMCQKCGLVRSNPILEESRIHELYNQSCFIYSEEAPYAAQTYATLLAHLVKRCVNGPISNLLEIGSGTGFFLEKVITMGIRDVMGFEPSKDCLANASPGIRKRIINNVYDPDLLGGQTFDLVCGFHVFDHLLNPLETLMSLKGCLNPEGYVLLVCHDVESWTAKLLGDHSPIFDVEHIFLFSRETIRMLFERAGYQILEIGLLANRYPLSYWMGMLPFLQRMTYALPTFLQNLPITIRGGNFYVFGKKQ